LKFVTPGLYGAYFLPSARRFNIHELSDRNILLGFVSRFVDNFFMTAIALLTDFGTKYYFVGAMKGAILSINPQQAVIVDVTHEIAPQDDRSAAFTLRACYENFPTKTIFVAVVDPGVGSERRAVLAETKDYFFVAPDNGLLSFIFDEAESFENDSSPGSELSPRGFRVFELTNREYFAENVSRTFHRRDIFAPVAAHLANGIGAGEFGREITDFICFETISPKRISETEIEAEIIHIDCFGNLVTNLKSEDLPPRFILKVNGTPVRKHQKYYAEAETGELFSIAGSAGFLEIAAFRASAGRLLLARVGQKVLLQTAN
jgi:S-adenosyl-L-methionine hydrolase (adenosine-forming)